MKPLDKMNIDDMYKMAGIDRMKLQSALKQMGKKYINGKEYKDEWTEDNPTRHYCYVVSEMVKYYYLNDATPHILKNIEGETLNHRYLVYNNEVIDLTQDQFDNPNKLNYNEGKPQSFMYVKEGISKRAKLLKELYDQL